METRHDLHESLARDEQVKGSSERQFGLTFAVLFLLLTALLLVWRNTAWPVALVLALAFGGLAAFAPSRLRPLNRLWLRFGLALHAIVSPVVLSILFFGVITPVGILARFAGKDFLRLTFNRQATTYWIDRQPPGPSPKSMRNQF